MNERRLSPQRRYQLAYPERHAAREAVRYAVETGRLLSASAQSCGRCGVPAHQYHHLNGYARDHWLDVQPLCRTCHGLAHRMPPRPKSPQPTPRVWESDWMTLEEAAQEFQVSLVRLRKAAQRGTLVAEKPQGKRTMPYLVTAAAVEHYLATVRRGRPPKVKELPDA